MFRAVAATRLHACRGMSSITRLNTPAMEPTRASMAGFEPKLVSGNPSTKVFVQYKNTGDLICGTWECEPGSWQHNNKVDEYVMLLEGEMALKADGKEEVFKAGDSFVIPAGWQGIWEVRVTMKKYWVKHASA
mmetsp:Transcript_1246/g.2859  ORF Transcript_1246/g.2859 Transcript_1246/m.2859 type:complete len:133 (+) Transcript_1246:52-450(+)|eukprot:CAMPEP_0115285612 /NCGR_PEP_ID=MMETSP0270-20121206/61520_1 /TAXON_ID=71861 /ORGANISM="Scrippsiella trochoidea, Strain CCMP3099" /LENGTH=132 /DNA_ID=CAMNT_0002702639 /DNA_START=52 /DNA_END=450 /DNA_ORIENTATION=+